MCEDFLSVWFACFKHFLFEASFQSKSPSRICQSCLQATNIRSPYSFLLIIPWKNDLFISKCVLVVCQKLLIIFQYPFSSPSFHWEQLLNGSFVFLHILLAQTLTVLCSWFSFQGWLSYKKPGEIEIVSLPGGRVGLVLTSRVIKIMLPSGAKFRQAVCNSLKKLRSPKLRDPQL